MTTAAGWYGDPLRPGRLRYWDGAAWTAHVSEGGDVAQDPLGDVPPAPPAAVSPPPGAPAAAVAGDTGRGRYRATLLGRAGFALAAVGGVLAAATAGSTAVRQEGLVRFEVTGGAWLGIAAAVLCVAAALSPFAWGRVAGVGVSALFAVLLALAVIGLRTSDDLVSGVDVSLATAGWLLLAGSLVLMAGTAVALAGLRVPQTAPDPAAQPREGRSVAALVLGIVGLLIPPLAAPAVALGLYARDDARATEGRVGRTGMATAGVVLGIVSLTAWTVGLTVAMLVVQP